MKQLLRKKNRRKLFLISGFLTIVFLILVCAFLVSADLSKINNHLDLLTISTQPSSQALANSTFIEFKSEIASHISTMKNVLYMSLAVLIVFSAIIIYEAYKSSLFKEELDDQREHADFLAGAKKDFIANMSHEMKTPLHAIFGITQELAQDEGLVIKHGKLLDKLLKSSNHLLDMVEDLLMVSNDGEIVKSFQNVSFNLYLSIQEICEEYRKKAHLKGLDFIVKSHVVSTVLLKGDVRRLQHIIAHILDNSLKFTHEGKIELSYWLKEKSKEEANVYLQISDTGIGISEQKLKGIFQEFEQADNTLTKQYPGIGVGLAITKKMVNWQGGSISVSSQEGSYTKFTVSLPYRFVTLAGNSVKTEPKQNKPSILIVDDDEFNLLLATGMLKKKNCKVDTAAEGNEAFLLLQAKEYDVILLDIHLPKISGVGVAEALRNSKGKNSNTPILAVTATLLSESVLENFKTAGINDWLPKPYKEEQLWEKINLLMEAEKYHIS